MRSDPVTNSVLWHAFVALAEECGVVIERTAHSQVIREAGDFSTGIFDAEGRMLGQGAHSVGHLGSMNRAVATLVQRFPTGALRDGDVVVFNDPCVGAGHLPDIYLLAPVYVGDSLVAYVANTAHHSDLGGPVPGSQAIADVHELIQEGLFIPPVRVRANGRRAEDVWQMILANSRTPGAVAGDLQAQMAGIDNGIRQYTELIERYGEDVVQDAGNALLEWSESQMREAISELPEGEYEAEDFMDGYGPGTSPIKLCARVSVHDGTVTVDWAGSSDQVPAGMNSYINFTFAYSYFAVKAIVAPDVPQNDGCLRPVSVVAPAGSVVNPRPGAACGGRAVMNYRLFEVVVAALAQACPERVVAPGAQAFNLTFGGISNDQESRFVYYELLLGCFGGRAGSDGPDGLTSITNTANVPIEITESLVPLRIERFEFMKDKCGAGKFRGGAPIQRDFRVLARELIFTNGSDRHLVPPPGILGGEAGAVAETILNPGPMEERLDSKGTYILKEGDLLSIRPAGSGGYGRPSERTGERVRSDIDQGLLSKERAIQQYGLAVVEGLEE